MQRPDLELPIIGFYMAKGKNLLIISDRNFFSTQPKLDYRHGF
jgi:hypothetical protein